LLDLSALLTVVLSWLVEMSVAGLTVYDSFIAPLALMIWKGEGSWTEIMIQVAITCILLPIEIMRGVFGICATSSVLDLAAELEDAACEMATTSAELLQDEEEGEEEEVAEEGVLVGEDGGGEDEEVDDVIS
jgi:hypothetical protein